MSLSLPITVLPRLWKPPEQRHFPLRRRSRQFPGAGSRLIFLIFLAALRCAAEATPPIHYVVNVQVPDTHLVSITMRVPAATPATEIQIPSWNNLYQIRDFVRNVQGLDGACDGQPAELIRVDLNTWRGPPRSCADLEFHYSVFAQEDGPFSSMLNLDHAFLNFATLLFYLPKERARAVQVTILHPEGWKLATLLEGRGDEFQAPNYDALVDSPLEAGHFEEYTYTQDLRTPEAAPASPGKQATFRIIIHADPGDYSADHLLDSIRRITATETALMQDLPFERYTFFLHFPREPETTGGMEHRNGTAITVPASMMRTQQAYLEEVAAHEFFHAWNVKRLRPQALEPIDYIHGNDTRDLWFCEGVTNTYAELVLLRAELINRDTFYTRLADAIQALEVRPARLIQSVEASGRDAWLEKYADYNRPDRSISYYNKGELLGYLLDLGIRHASHNQASLDDVMRCLNEEFAQRGRFYTLTDIRAIVQRLAPSFAMDRFIADDIQGTEELDYATFLGYAGLHFIPNATERPAPGFTVARNLDGLLEVQSVEGGSDAQRAGLQPGDVLLGADGDPLPVATSSDLPAWPPGRAVELQVAREGSTRNIAFRVGVNQEVSFQVKEDPEASPDQLRLREGWLKGGTTPPTAPDIP